MNMSQYLAQKVQDHLWGKTTYTAAATVYVALFNTSPDPTGGGTEVSASGTAYARASVTNNTGNFPGASLANPSVKANGAAVTFPTATASWGTVGFWGVFDAATNGNLLMWGALTTPQVVNTGGTVSFANAGDLSFLLG